MANTLAQLPLSGSNMTGVGTVAWVNPSYITTTDTNNATFTGASYSTTYSNYLRASNFNFAIPDGQKITGIILVVKGKKGLSSLATKNIKDNIIKIVNASGSVVGDDKADKTTLWPTTAGEFTYGSSSDNWGLNLLSADVNDTDFGVVISAVSYTETVGPKGYIESVTLQLFYEPDAVAPTVTTQDVTNIEKQSATANGTITDTGGENATRRGFCYKVGVGDPTVSDNVVFEEGSFGTGSFSKDLI